MQEFLRLKALCEASGGNDDLSDSQMVILLKGIARCVALVQERHHEVLVTEVLNLNLWSVSPKVREAILAFVCHAVASNGAFIQSCLHILVYSLVAPPGPPSPDPNPGESWLPIERDVVVQDSVIAATKRVLELVPTAIPRLMPILVSNMPHKMRDRGTHCLYFRGMFAVAESQPNSGLSDGLLPPIVSHLIDVDVDIKWEDIVEIMTEEAKEEEKGERMPRDDEPDIFDLEGMSEGEACLAGYEPRGGWEGCGDAEVINPAPDKLEETEKQLPVDETADKMDSLMELTLQHLKHRISRGELQHVWKSLLDAFDSIILQTHRSKFTQFLIFYVASHSPVHCSKSLLHMLLSKLGDKNQAPITRSACAAYIGSFLARAAFVPELLVVESFQKLAEWCIRYIREEDRRGGLPPIPSAAMLGNANDAITRHAAFFAACQALLYALCYHMEPLSQKIGHLAADLPGQFGSASSAPDETKSVKEQCAGVIHRLFVEVMPNILQHPLDPLSSCAKSVVTEFSRQAQSLGYAEIARIVYEWEKRCDSSGSNKFSRPLEIFFPFDPYLLRRSAGPLDLQHNFVKWRKGHPTAVLPEDGIGDDQPIGGSSDEDLMSSDLDSELQNSDTDSSLDLSSSSESDELKRTRFGSMPDSSVSSGGRRFLSRKLPAALKASIAHGGMGSSPTGGVPIMHDSPSTENGSPWGMSPASAYYGSFAPMSFTSNDKFPTS